MIPELQRIAGWMRSVTSFNIDLTPRPPAIAGGL